MTSTSPVGTHASVPAPSQPQPQQLQQQQQPQRQPGGRKSILVPITCSGGRAQPTLAESSQPLLVEVAGALSPTQTPDSGLGTPCISSASTDSSACSSGRRRRANQPLRTSSSDDDSAEDTSSCASSTAYQRVPGFHDHAHAHPLVAKAPGRQHGRLKEKRPMLLQQQLPAVVAAASVPMRSRHLPKSMWQEPDVPNYSPALLLPRLALHRSVDDVSELGLTQGHSSTSPFKSGAGARPPMKPQIRTVLNLDPSEALQRRLFDVAFKSCGSPSGEQQKKRPLDRLQPIAQRPPVSTKSNFLSNNDPCLSDSNKFPYLARTCGGLASGVADTVDSQQGHQLHQPQLYQRESPSQLLAEVAKQL